MKLRSKLLIILLGCIVLTGTTHSLIQHLVIYPQFQALEHREAEKDIQRCVQAIDTEVGHLKALCNDWASWDDTYEFLQSHSQDYLDSNLALETFVNAQLNAIYFYDVQGKPFWGMSLDLETKQPMALYPLMTGNLQAGHPLFIDLNSLTTGTDISRIGLLKTEYGFVMAASLPVLTSENKGPAKGTLVMARLITPVLSQKLRAQTRVPFDLKFVETAGSNISAGGAIKTVIQPVDQSLLMASILMEDIAGNPCILLEASLPRDIMLQGYATMHTIRNVTILIALILLVLLLWLLAVTIVQPITRLTGHVLTIRKSGDYSARCHSGRADEIGMMEQEFDRLLETIARQSRELEAELVFREEIAQQLGESMQKYKLLAENLKDVVVAISPDGVVQYCSPAIFEFSGHSPEEVVGMHVHAFLADERERRKLVQQVEAIVRSGHSQSAEFVMLSKNGKPFPVESSAKPIMENGKLLSLQCVIRDISPRKKVEEEKARLEAKLQQAHKMEAIGTLAGGIAHNFNNVLFPIMGFTELAMMEIPKESQAQESLKDVLAAAERAKKLVRQIMAFSSHGVEDPKLVFMENIVEDVLIIIRASLPSTIEIRKDIVSTGWMIYADPIEIQRVIMNICSNAAHAMKDTGGVMELMLSVQDIAEYDLGPARKIAPGRYIKLAISDNGPGMDRDVMERIFDPYFTTKPVGQGSGMGLSEAHALVEKNGGEIKVYSEPGLGASFYVYLPVQGDEPDQPLTHDLPGGNENVLIVDDEEQIIQMTRQLLERLGYHVTSSNSSTDALNLFQANPDAFDVVITDMTMPRMTGDSLARQILAIRPHIPIILCTGFSEKLSREQARGIGISAYLMKPVVMAQIASILRKVLDKT
ncbi:MAG: response regulator [Desulfatibacillum sp.]|nr:response regulator [Desulfatibacillum sp.]